VKKAKNQTLGEGTAAKRLYRSRHIKNTPMVATQVKITSSAREARSRDGRFESILAEPSHFWYPFRKNRRSQIYQAPGTHSAKTT